MTDKLISTGEYVVAGTNNGKLQYLCFDSSSGDYPYASIYLRDKTSSISKAVNWLLDAEKNLKKLKNPKIYSLMLLPVQTDEFEAEAKRIDKFLETLSDEQKEFLKRKL